MADSNTALNGAVSENEEEIEIKSEKMKQKMEKLEKEKKTLAEENEGMKDRVVKLTAEIESLRSEESEAKEIRKTVVAEVCGGEELKKVIGEKEGEIEGITKEKVETERKMRELERKIAVIEVRESEERSKRVRTEEEKEKEVFGYRNKCIHLESEAFKWRERVRVLERRVEELKVIVEESELERGNYDKFKLWHVVLVGSTVVVAAAAVVCRARGS